MKNFYTLMLLLAIGFTYGQKLNQNVKTIEREGFEVLNEKRNIELEYSSLSQNTSTSPVVGNLSGQLGVSNTGGASYVVPIKVPEGINGFQPEISLTYNSQQGNGSAGWGWNISGGSVITRVAATKYHDDRVGSVKFQKWSTGDRFALDGQRLILETGSYGNSTSTYKTENYSNLKITGLGISSYGSGYGHESFRINHPDGSMSYYGLTSNSRTRMNYAISKFVNPSGLEIKYSYINSGESLYLSSISYGNLESQSHPYIIRFTYQNRVLPSETFVHGQRFLSTKILKSIYSTVSGFTYSNYYIKHDTNQMGYQRLVSITEKNGNNTEAKSPLTFDFFDLEDQTPIYESRTNVGFQNIDRLNSKTVTGDFDGDGKSDFVIFPNRGNDNFRKYWVVTDIRNDDDNFPDFEVEPGFRFDDIFSMSYTNHDNKLMDRQAWVLVYENSDNITFKAYTRGISSPIINVFEKNIPFPKVTIKAGCESTAEDMCDTRIVNRIFPKRLVYGDFNGDGLKDAIAFDVGLLSQSICREDDYEYDCNEESIQPRTSNSIYFVNLDPQVDDNNSVSFLG